MPVWIALSSLLVALTTIVAAELRDRRNAANQREMQRLELEERRLSTLRNERIKAYSTLARLTKSIWFEAPEYPLPALYEALSQVEILAGDPELKAAAEGLVDKWASAWEAAYEARLKGDSAFAAPGFEEAEAQLIPLRNTFIERAKKELQVAL